MQAPPAVAREPLPAEEAVASSEASPTWVRRAVAGGIAAAALTVLLLAAWVDPNPAGHGTHTQLGLPPCGFELATRLPCATCGMTTAFAHAANGDFVASFVTQPAGLVLAVLTAVAVLVGGYIAATAADPRPLARLWTARTVIAMAGLVVAAWAYKVVLTLGVFA
jgi:hypothetical protein